MELLESEPSLCGKALLLGPHGFDPFVHRIDVTKRIAHGVDDVSLLGATEQDLVLAPNLAEADGEDEDEQHREERDAPDHRKAEGQFVHAQSGHGAPSYTSTMRPEEVKDLLRRVADGDVSTEQAFALLARSPVDDLGFAQLDLHRELRQGIPEAIYAEGKTTEEVLTIAQRLLDKTEGPVIATRVPDDAARELARAFPGVQVHERARVVVLRASPTQLGTIAVVAAGTSDLAVAEEAEVTATALGAEVRRIVDVGVAGVHRVLNVQDQLVDARVVIVVAGMEGALASLVGGLVAAPVVAVPTSVGYGASFEGLAALLAMLNSCAAGITVTNIDNGFGAAVFAVKVLRATG